MIRALLVASLALVCVASNAEARHKSGPWQSCTPTGDVMRPCAYQPNFLAGVRSIRVTMKRDRQAARVEPFQPRQRTAGLSSAIIAPLAAKVAEIQSACGSRVISDIRHTNIAGTRRLSLHASGKAVDLQGNPGCIYGHLAGWPGGVSTDYARMRHVHLSYDPDGGREMGLRFVHGGHRHARRFARHRHQRYARAG